MRGASHNKFDDLIAWGRLAAAHARRNSFCVEQHRRTLLERGEPDSRVDQVEFAPVPHLFSEAERNVISLSEAISHCSLTDDVESLLKQARLHLNPEEIQHLVASVLAVNDWIDAQDKDPIRVLVVEDNLDDQELLDRQLQKTCFGSHVLFVSDPRIALDLIQSPDSPDFRKHLIAIMLDLKLPYMSGLELLRIIRTLEDWKDFPVIIMTTDNSPSNRAAAEELNAMAFVAKPVTLSSFARVIAPLFHQPVNRSERVSIVT